MLFAANAWAIIFLLIESNKINRLRNSICNHIKRGRKHIAPIVRKLHTLMNHESLIYILSGGSNVQITNKRYEKLFQSYASQGI
jgi:hypothetical protein